MKKLVSLALALVMALSLAACGDEGSGFDPSAFETKGTKYAGDYRVSTMLVGGERYEYDDIVAMGMADDTYLRLKEDGTGVIAIGDGEEMAVKIDDWKGTLTFDDGTQAKFWEESVSSLGVEFEEAGLTIYYTTESEPGEFPLSFIDTYGGDWVGQGKFVGCTGDFAGNNDMVCPVIARLVFDDAGNCTIFAGLSTGSDESNLHDLTVSYDKEYNDMILQGTLLGYPLMDVSYVEYKESEGLLCIAVEAKKNDSSLLGIMAYLRHPGDKWDYDNDPYPLDEASVEKCANTDFLTLVEQFGIDPSRVPDKAPASSGNNGGTTTPAAPSKGYSTSGFDGKAKLYYEDLIAVDYPTSKFHDDGDGIGCDDPYLYIFAQTILSPNSSSVAGCEEDMSAYAKDSDYSSVTDENIMLGSHAARRVVAESDWMGNIAVYLIDLGSDGNDSAGWAFINVKYEDASALETAEAILSTIRAK